MQRILAIVGGAVGRQCLKLCQLAVGVKAVLNARLDAALILQFGTQAAFVVIIQLLTFQLAFVILLFYPEQSFTAEALAFAMGLAAEEIALGFWLTVRIEVLLQAIFRIFAVLSFQAKPPLTVPFLPFARVLPPGIVLAK